MKPRGPSDSLRKLGRTGDRSSAEVATKGSVSGTMQGMDVTVDMSGSMVIDVATGQCLESEMIADMKMKGVSAGTSMTCAGRTVTKQTNTLVP